MRLCGKAWLATALLALAVTPAFAGQKESATLQGAVQSGGSGLPLYKVSLYIAYLQGGPDWKLLGTGTSDGTGRFFITYAVLPGLAEAPSLLFVQAERGPVLLASAISMGPTPPAFVVVNERTTVATGAAYAQFVESRKIAGNPVGMLNALPMAANFANPFTGAVGGVINSLPNGTDTTTLATFNSLSNAVASCVAEAINCSVLFQAATPPGGAAPTNVLQAIANIIKNPSYPGYPSIAQDPVFLLSQLNPIYQPALTQRPTSWLLFLKITGGFYSTQDFSNLMSGPGNFAIDGLGFVWLNENYDPAPPTHFACAGHRLIKFHPWGQPVPGTPYIGGGLEGAGWGITLDPRGNVWVGNFGFQDPACLTLPVAAKNNSVSLFQPDGVPITGAGGFTQGNISWPMGTVSDPRGTISIANCGNDSITRFPGGDPARAINIPLGPTPSPGNPQIKPFGEVIDAQGNLWITGNRSSSVYVLSTDGVLIDTIPGTYNGTLVFSHPIGNTIDSQGNVWVANSDWLDAPCPTKDVLGTAQNPSVTLIQAKDRKPHPGSPFMGGGITLPWGIAVDGDDTVWVFNFGAKPPTKPTELPINVVPTGIARLCGVQTKKCPPGLKVGDPISPATGYQSDAIERITSGAIDPSGNIWITNNWKIKVDPNFNPGGNAIVIAVGAAAPLRTPLFGPPIPFK